MAFRREKFVPRGGPSGGDGGRGGDVWIISDASLNTLLHLRYEPRHIADRGRHGEGSNCSGRDGNTKVIRVPVGTLIFDAETNENLFDFCADGVRWLAARGGRGGFGNAHFATSTNRAPRYHQEGKPGEERELQLELKLLADVGLVGFPNAGKSTLISAISAARPKIADYPFTTLEPHLGVVKVADYKTFVMADIPGLIEGAHNGAGLGTRFLRHLERTRLLLHLVDISPIKGRDPVSDYECLKKELRTYDERLARRRRIVVATKIDTLNASALNKNEHLDRLQECAMRDGWPFYKISAISHHGLRELVNAVAAMLDETEEALRINDAQQNVTAVSV